MNKQCVIVIDSGFSLESMRGLKILAARDLALGTTLVGADERNDLNEPRILKVERSEPNVLSAEQIESFACDQLNHGSIVLQRLRERLAVEDFAFILLRVFGADNSCIRTTWADGIVSSDGWTEAYLWAVNLCEERGYSSVANCSFGGFVHAADGTGWEAHQLSQVTGIGKRGHVVVAAAGHGDGRAVHASWFAQSGEPVWVSAMQRESTSYNFWFGAANEPWTLTVHRNGDVVGTHNGADIVGNMWNQRQQLTFTVEGGGDVSFEFALSDGGTESMRCDGWIRGDAAWFHDHVDSLAVSEPAVFSEVVAVGLRLKSYSPNQSHVGSKPDVLLEGTGEISFRTPEVTATVAQLMLRGPGLDSAGVRDALTNVYPK
jgi:hypothetical protein